jgi:hypothetical protein
MPLLAEEAKARRGARTDLVEKIPPSEFGKARDQAAKIVGVNPHYVSDDFLNRVTRSPEAPTT